MKKNLFFCFFDYISNNIILFCSVLGLNMSFVDQYKKSDVILCYILITLSNKKKKDLTNQILEVT